MKRTYRTLIALDSRKRLYLPVPFDPDAEWGPKPRHHVRGAMGPVKTRGALQKFDGAWGLRLNPLSQAACQLTAGDEVEVALWPEGPQPEDLAPDIMVALAAEPAALAAFQGLATFYRKGWLTWIDGTKRRPEERARRITELVEAMKAGRKERPRPPR
jgi:Bacteriocin-protection, YdeI or OmpD-Associated/Domain of unknown function (DUF1905)